jgi:hypothetical protein
MTALPADVWAMMLFCNLAILGVSIWLLIYTLRQEDQKLEIFQAEGTIDPYSPWALRELRDWIEAHPGDADIEEARERYQDCVQALRSTSRSFHDWSDQDIRQLEDL